MISNQSRTGETKKKTVTLTDSGREQIQHFADLHHLTFSAAIESLALIGMEADLTDLILPLLQDTVNRAMQRNFNRLAKLNLISAAEAAMAHQLTTMLLLQIVRQEAVRYPADFEERMGVSYEPDDEPDARIRSLYNYMRQLARQRQQQLLKRPLAQLVSELTAVGEVTDGSAEDPEGGADE